MNSLVLVSLPKVHHSHDTPRSEREALLPRADLGRGEIHAHRVHAHRGAGLSAVRPDLPQAPVSRLGARGSGRGCLVEGNQFFLLALLIGTLKATSCSGQQPNRETFDFKALENDPICRDMGTERVCNKRIAELLPHRINARCVIQSWPERHLRFFSHYPPNSSPTIPTCLVLPKVPTALLPVGASEEWSVGEQRLNSFADSKNQHSFPWTRLRFHWKCHSIRPKFGTTFSLRAKEFGGNFPKRFLGFFYPPW